MQLLSARPFLIFGPRDHCPEQAHLTPCLVQHPPQELLSRATLDLHYRSLRSVGVGARRDLKVAEPSLGGRLCYPSERRMDENRENWFALPVRRRIKAHRCSATSRGLSGTAPPRSVLGSSLDSRAHRRVPQRRPTRPHPRIRSRHRRNRRNTRCRHLSPSDWSLAFFATTTFKSPDSFLRWHSEQILLISLPGRSLSGTVAGLCPHISHFFMLIPHPSLS